MPGLETLGAHALLLSFAGVLSSMKRLLVTGSRNWTDTVKLSWGLGLAIGWLNVPLDELSITHGACPEGVDLMTDRLASIYGYDIKRVPADWARYGKSAGHRRNAEMAADRPLHDLCVAFIAACDQANCNQPGLHGSHGARGCAFQAEKHGILTWRFYEDDSIGTDSAPMLRGSERS
jgi:hypothetical protein